MLLWAHAGCPTGGTAHRRTWPDACRLDGDAARIREAQARRVESLLDAFDWTDGPTRDDHIAAARLYRQCRAKGVTVRSTIDCLIAQLCIRDNLPLLAKDRDFTEMAKVVPLVVV